MTVLQIYKLYKKLENKLAGYLPSTPELIPNVGFINYYDHDRALNLIGVEVTLWRNGVTHIKSWTALTEFVDFEDFDVFSGYLNNQFTHQIEINDRDDGILKFDTYQESVKKLEELISEEINKRNGTN